MAYTTINKSTDYFNTKLYTGNGSTQTISGVGHQPDWTWAKVRSEVGSHRLADAVRGNTKYLFSNGTDAEATDSTNITSWNSDGFALGNGSINENTRTYASWNWKANGAGSANTTGSINSTVSVNTTSGFSIVKYTGTGANATVGHGLGVAPKMIHVKGINTNSTNWLTGGSNISSNWASSLHLNTTAGIDTYNYWQNYAPNANVFYMTSDGALNQSGIDYIAYCFSDVQGYSKFGSYIGNGSTDGPFVYTGFKPAFVMVKKSSSTENWYIFDNKRSDFNLSDDALRANLNNAEISNWGVGFDFCANGFKARATDGAINASGATYIYMAFAENPFVTSTGVPATAR